MLVLALGAAGYLGYELYGLNQAHEELNQKLDRAQDQAYKLQQRYRQQKAVEANLTRTKLALEGKVRAQEKQISELEEEKKQLAAAKASLENRLATKVKDQIADLEKDIAELKSEVAKRDKIIESKEKQYTNCIAERNEAVSALNGRIVSLESNLADEETMHARCREHNTELSQIGLELLEAYHDKGVTTSAVQLEPLIQSLQIEVEKFIQEYQDRIDEHQLGGVFIKE